MAVTRHERLGVGVIGLGRLWEARHRSAFARLHDRFRVVALYDQVARRARVEAEAVGCAVAEGLTALFERPDVDVVYLLSPQWFGSHAAELAIRSGKPLYYGLPVAADPDGLRAMSALAVKHDAIVIPELARRVYPASMRLRELLATTLGPPRLVRGHVRLYGFDRYGSPGPNTQLAQMPMMVDPGANLLDWCRWLFQAEPTAITGFGAVVLPGATDQPPGEDYEGFALEFPDGALAQITLERFHRGPWEESKKFLPHPGFQVFAERGAAWLEMPDRIQWNEPSGAREQRLASEASAGELLNEHVYRRVQGQPSFAPSLDDALIASRLVQQYRLSRQEGRRIPLEPARTDALPS